MQAAESAFSQVVELALQLVGNDVFLECSYGEVGLSTEKTVVYCNRQSLEAWVSMGELPSSFYC